MAYRPIQTTIWKDTYILELNPNEKLVFIYVLTNDFTTQSGIYELSLQHAAMELNLTPEQVLVCLKRLQDDGKIVYSIETREIAVINWLKHNNAESWKTLERVKKELMKVKNSSLVLYLYDPRIPLYDGSIKKKSGNEWREIPYVINNPWSKTFENLTDDELLQIRASINKPHTRGIQGAYKPHTRGIPHNITEHNITEQIHNITEQNKTKHNIGHDDDLSDIKILESIRHEHTSETINRIITLSHSMPAFPDEKRLLVNYGNAIQIKDSLSFYTIKEIRKTFSNYGKCYNSPDIYKISPFATIITFITNGGLDKFADSSDPLNKYKINRKNNGVDKSEAPEDIF